jgi:hypothetical protein
MAVAEQDDDYDDEESAPPEQPWHNRTPAVIGASVLGVVVISFIVLTVSYVAREFSEPERAPLNFVEPSFSATAPASSRPSATTTATITTTSRPQTTDLPPGPPPTSSSDTAGTESTRRNRDGEDDDTTRRRPRTNVTRTFTPFTP